MHICFPINEDQGMDSTLCPHFGSAPQFLIVDTDTGATRALPNMTHQHGHGSCRPLDSFAGERLDGIVVSGIGRGALERLQAAGVEVYLAEHETVASAVAAFKAGGLRSVSAQDTCAHHGHGHGHGHEAHCQGAPS